MTTSIACAARRNRKTKTALPARAPAQQMALTT